MCGKPLYRRPNEMARARYAACMAHRAAAQSVIGVTDAQRRGLSLGSQKGTNHRIGYKHREESKQRVAAANQAYWAANPDRAKARARRGETAHNWKGGISRLNASIRQMHENRKWMDAVKERDGACLRCGSKVDLEAHHKNELATLIEKHDIKNRDDARACVDLWDANNGETLCQKCHFAEHGRAWREAA